MRSSSMQPPETEPNTVPSSHKAMMEPMGRGEEPQVRTTVANKARRPALRQSRSARKTTRSILSMAKAKYEKARLLVYCIRASLSASIIDAWHSTLASLAIALCPAQDDQNEQGQQGGHDSGHFAAQADGDADGRGHPDGGGGGQALDDAFFIKLDDGARTQK